MEGLSLPMSTEGSFVFIAATVAAMPSWGRIFVQSEQTSTFTRTRPGGNSSLETSVESDRYAECRRKGLLECR